MAKHTSFRVGKVRAYRAGQGLVSCSTMRPGQRRRPRVGPDRDLARQMAAQINGQLEVGAPAALSFEPISIPDLRQRWLDHHEHVRRSSVQTIRRYRAATEHLLTFVRDVCPVRHGVRLPTPACRGVCPTTSAHQGGPQWPPAKPASGRSRDAGIKFILETCSSLFNYAQRNRHLSPYAENPFRTIEVSRMPVEDFRPIVVFTDDQERRVSGSLRRLAVSAVSDACC